MRPTTKVSYHLPPSLLSAFAGVMVARVNASLLKALWGVHTAALQFMLGIQLQVGERKHAIRERRFARGRKHEDMHAIYLAGSVSNTYVCDVGFKIVSRIMT